MAIARDASSSAVNASASSLTFSHTCTGSNLLLLVGVGANSTDTSGVTYNGVAMTQIATDVTGTAGYASLWGLLAPSTGANNIVVTQTTTTYMSACAVSYTGVVQSGLPSITGTDSATPLSISLTTTVDNSWLVVFGKNDASVDGFSNGTNGTIVVTPNGNITSFADSNAAKSPAGSYTTAMTSSSNVVGVACAIAPAADISHHLLLLGIGT